jgi:multiple sugar transport system ATP-binding protein
MSRVALDGVSKRFGDVTAVDELTLEIQDREFLVLLGPSGCGKTTALRMVAGLEAPTEGTITIGSTVVNDIEPKNRDIAMVFQSYALYPHMTVERNIEFPLKSRDVPKEERASAVQEAARMLGLDTLLGRKPAELSGGQRQRVALARAVVRRPAAFLMDEPLSNLDAKLRVQTRAELIELQRRLEATVIYVTHDQVEAMTMGHRIAIMESGVLQQVDAPQKVYEKPANLFVARFIGNPPMNTIEGDLGGSDGNLELRVNSLSVALPQALAAAAKKQGVERAVLGLRPEDLAVGSEGLIPAKVTVVESLGHERHVICRLDDDQMVIVRQQSDETPPKEGEPISLSADTEHVHLFDAKTGNRVEP